MKHYLKLVNFELNRFIKIYVVLLAITLVSQITGVIVMSKQYLKVANQEILDGGMSQASFINNHGTIAILDVMWTWWFLGPIAVCVTALMFYIFLIWYRDWFGKNTFIYRLLMLPTSRLNVFFAKATAIMVAVLGLVSFQLILLPIEMNVLKWMIPRHFRTDLGIVEVIEYSPAMQVIFPQSFLGFLLSYGLGFMFVLIFFTAILFERSYRVKGFVMGIVYSLLAINVFLSPILLQTIFNNFSLYPVELLTIEIIIGVIVIAGSIWLSGFLLKNKVTV